MNNNNINLKPTEKMGYINFWCQKVIPLVFDDSLSYYEAICKFMQKLNEVISALNNNAECIDELQGKYIILQNNFNALEVKWEEFKTYIENKFNTFKTEITTKEENFETTINNEFNSFKNYVENYLNNIDVQSYVNIKIDELAESGYFTTLLTNLGFNPDNYLAKNNTTVYVPSTDYNPATKKYVDDKFIGIDLEIVGTIPQSELQSCNNGHSNYVSSIDFDTLFSEPNNYLYYVTYKDDTLIPIDYQSNLNRMVTNRLDTVDNLDVFIAFDYGTHKMYPFNGGTASIKAYTFTNDLIIKRRPILNADMIATKEYVDKHVGNRIITVNNVNDSLTLTTNKLQHTTLTIPVEVILPTVTEYTEIHLFFNGSEGAELNTTNVKWESQLTIENNKSYEVVFTYVNDVVGWLAKSIIYS